MHGVDPPPVRDVAAGIYAHDQRRMRRLAAGIVLDEPAPEQGWLEEVLMRLTRDLGVLVISGEYTTRFVSDRHLALTDRWFERHGERPSSSAAACRSCGRASRWPGIAHMR